MTSDEAAELREFKRRNRLLEQQNEVLRRAAAYLSQANLKLGGSSKRRFYACCRAMIVCSCRKTARQV